MEAAIDELANQQVVQPSNQSIHKQTCKKTAGKRIHLNNHPAPNKPYTCCEGNQTPATKKPSRIWKGNHQLSEPPKCPRNQPPNRPKRKSNLLSNFVTNFLRLFQDFAWPAANSWPMPARHSELLGRGLPWFAWIWLPWLNQIMQTCNHMCVEYERYYSKT